MACASSIPHSKDVFLVSTTSTHSRSLRNRSLFGTAGPLEGKAALSRRSAHVVVVAVVEQGEVYRSLNSRRCASREEGHRRAFRILKSWMTCRRSWYRMMLCFCDHIVAGSRSSRRRMYKT